MKSMTRLVLAVLLASAAFGVALAAEEPKEIQLTGYITDEYCGAKNANPKGADCARDCAKKGSKMAIFSEGKIYLLSDKEAALAHLGYKVVVSGTLGEGGVVQVRSIEKAKGEA